MFSIYKWLAEHAWLADVVATVVVMVVMVVVLDIMYHHWRGHKDGFKSRKFLFLLCLITIFLCLLRIFNIFLIKHKLIAYLISLHTLVFLMILCLMLYKSSSDSQECAPHQVDKKS